MPLTAASPGTDPRRYIRIAAAVRRQVDDGTLKPRDTVPIAALTREHGVSRKTAAKALGVLEAEGRLKRYPGLGYTVQGHQQPAA
jgi:DNA-binding GntR family transcriptional regulator